MRRKTASFMEHQHGLEVPAALRGTCAAALIIFLLSACGGNNDGLSRNGIDSSVDGASPLKTDVARDVAKVSPDTPTTCVNNGVVYSVNQSYVVQAVPCPMTCLCQAIGPSCITVCSPDGGTPEAQPGVDGAPRVTCSRSGNTYDPGETIQLSDGCGGWCVCKSDGTFQCTPACGPDGGADAPIDSPLNRPEAGPETTIPPIDGRADAPRDASVDLPRDVGPEAGRQDALTCTSASACPTPASGHGTAVCQAGACGITCDNSYHRCGDACASNTSVATCGTGTNSCAPCANPPANASATCGGNPLACGFACNNGYHRCGNTCVGNNSTDPSSCGSSCTVCQAPTNGSVTCNGSSCVLACTSGYHLCGTTCVANNSSSGCGTSCGACPDPAHGTPACNGSPLTCGVTCDSGYHQCGNTCIANNSTSGCGGSCDLCPTDPNGQATCNGTQCGITCSNGYHWCNSIGQCVSNASAAHCGTSCTPCPTATGATATCRGTPLTCGLDYTCSDGYIECGGTCVLESASQCSGASPSCGACPAPGAGVQHAKAVCAGGTCDLACVDGYHDCGTTTSIKCVSNNDKANCGSSCTPCPDPPPNGSASCDGTTCTVVCATGYHLCGGACVSSNDLNTCGTSCNSPCPYPPDSQRNTTEATCDGTKCGFDCLPGNHMCGTGTQAACQPDDDAHCGTGANCKDCTNGTTCVNNLCQQVPDGGA